MAGELYITDGTRQGTIDLKTGVFRLVDWTPAIAPIKGEGVWQDSMLDDGRRLIMAKRANTTEVFDLRVCGATQNDTIRETQALRRLLEKARAFWTNPTQNAPVWLETRGPCETNTRYAYIMNYSTPNDDNPFMPPFNAEAIATMDEWTLNIERSDWQANPPGDGTCVQISGLQAYSSITGNGTYMPTQSDDDVNVNLHLGVAGTPSTTEYIGLTAGDLYANGIRFRNVAVPAGATILSATLTVVASNNDANGLIPYIVFGELNAHPAVFSTYADFVARTPTVNTYKDAISDNWTAGTSYVIASGADLVNVLQEIVDLPGWAAGHNLALLLYSVYSSSTALRRYASWDNVTYAEPALFIEWETDEAIRGREATCTQEVYFANKHNQAQISHAYYWDAAPGVWSDIMAAALPANIFPAVPAAGDILYLGCDTTLVNSGPFASAIFDIGTAANDIIDVSWEYWNGGWVALTVLSTLDTSVPAEFFNVAGVGSVSFAQPSDWTTTAVNGVTGYWIRCSILAVGAAPTAPTQANRLIYTVVRPSVDVDELQVTGDITSLARLKVRDYSGSYHIASAILATRSTSRGDDFTMYLNASDEQNNPLIGFVTPVGCNVSVANWLKSPAGRCAHYNPGAGSTGFCWFLINSDIAPDFYGTYRALLRVERHSAVTDCKVKLSLGAYDLYYGNHTVIFSTAYKAIISDDVGLVINFGNIDIPNMGALRDNDETSPILLRLDFANTTTTPDLYIYDLILVPVDEWAGQFLAADPTNETHCLGYTSALHFGGVGDIRHEVYLDVDSLNLKKRISACTRQADGDLLQYSWQDITPAAAQLQANADQQVFAMLFVYDPVDNAWTLPVEGIGTLEIEATARYLSMRGAN
jgi:hypothetical protein